MITHVHSAGVPVKDQDAALDFQVNKLGWDVQIDQMMGEDERYLTVAPKGGQTQVALMKDDGTIKHWSPSSWSPTIWMPPTPNWARRASNSRSRCRLRRCPGRQGAEIVDLDGNKFYINEGG